MHGIDLALENYSPKSYRVSQEILDYAQLTEPVNETTYNSLKPRNRGGVALYSLGNTKGSVIFMTLDTGREVAREESHILPMPDVVIPHLYALAAKGKKTLGIDSASIYHGLVIPVELPHQDVENTHLLPYLHIHSCSATHPSRTTKPKIRILGIVVREGCVALL